MRRHHKVSPKKMTFVFQIILSGLLYVAGASGAGRTPSFYKVPKPQRSFRDWCEDTTVSAGVSNTILALLKLAGTNDCELADDKLRNITQIADLDSNSNEFDLAPLASLSNLKELKVPDFHLRVTNFSALATLPNFQSLWLSNVAINLEELAGCHSLRNLLIDGKGVTNFSALSRLKTLRYFWLLNSTLADLTPLTSLTSLVDLRLINNAIRDVTPLSHLHELRTLLLGSNQISDISSLSRLKRIINLDVGDNPVRKLGLKEMPNLQYLNVNYTKASDIASVANLTSLVWLQADASGLKDLSVLTSLGDLSTLFLRYNQIVDVAGLGNLPALTNLELIGNSIIDVSPLRANANLIRLNLSFNKISDVSSLSSLVNLLELNLSKNPLTSKVCPVHPEAICVF